MIQCFIAKNGSVFERKVYQMKKTIVWILMLALTLSLIGCSADKSEEGVLDGITNAVTSIGDGMQEIFSSSSDTYTYKNDEWDLYIATFVSQKTIKIENWYRFYASDEYPFKYDHDVIVVSTDDDAAGFYWLDDDHTAFAITIKDEENSRFEEPKTVGFTKNNNTTESHVSTGKNIFTYRHDKWDHYVAVATSDTVITIECWYRFSAGEGADPFEYSYDVCSFSTISGEKDFKWLDDSHTAFSITILDERNSRFDEPQTVCFGLNSDYLATGLNGQSTVYTYLNDSWDLYAATFLTDNTVRIENWNRFMAGEDGDPFCYEHDVMILCSDFGESSFAWLDDTHAAFTVRMMDSENSHWDEITEASFVICGNFAEQYLLPAIEYENRVPEEDDELDDSEEASENFG